MGFAQAEVAKGALVKFVLPDQFSLAKQDPKPALQAMKKKKKKKKKKAKKGGHTKAAGVGLEGFMDWTDPTASELADEKEDDMSNLVTGFTTRMRERATSSQGETTPGFEVPDDKCPKLSSPDGWRGSEQLG